jgi:polyisoprenyl-teichoic acid--peptidoglycan teichoic acid transferase
MSLTFTNDAEPADPETTSLESSDTPTPYRPQWRQPWLPAPERPKTRGWLALALVTKVLWCRLLAHLPVVAALLAHPKTTSLESSDTQTPYHPQWNQPWPPAPNRPKTRERLARALAGVASLLGDPETTSRESSDTQTSYHPQWNQPWPPAPDRRKSRERLPLALAVVASLLVAALTTGALYAVSIDRAINDNLRHKSDQLPAAETARPAKGSGKAINYVLMGSDSRAVGNAGHGRSDALMVMHLAADRKSAYMISFPRDMYVPIPGHGKNKINAASAFGGPPLTVRTLERLLNIRMDHVAMIDFEGFINLTEELGGVRVYNKHSTVSQGYKFPAGDVNLRGDEALAYVRERKHLPCGDLDRAERQRAVLQAILAKGLAKKTITNPAKFLDFVRGVSRHVTVDDQLTKKELRETALSLRLGPKDIHMLQAPISGFGTSPTKQSIVIVDQKKMAQLAKALRNDQMDRFLDKYPEDIPAYRRTSCGEV